MSERSRAYENQPSSLVVAGNEEGEIFDDEGNDPYAFDAGFR